MKKSLFGRAFALLAAGAMLFAALGCDTGNDVEVLEEKPTTYVTKDKDFSSGSVTAVWDFSSFNAATIASEGNLGDVKATVDSAKTGSGASIDWSTAKGKSNTKVLQMSKATASLASPSSAWYFTLTLDSTANIYIKAKGAGAAEAARLVAVYDAAGAVLANKGNLGSGTDVEFVVIGAPAGNYTVYANGVSIYEINLAKSKADITEPKGYTANSDLFFAYASDTKTETINDTADGPATEPASWDNGKTDGGKKYTAFTAVHTDGTTKKTATYKGVTYTIVEKSSGVQEITIKDADGNEVTDETIAEALKAATAEDDTKAKTTFTLYPAFDVAAEHKIEALIETVKLALFDKDNNLVTSSAVWTSSDTSIATVTDGVVSGASAEASGTVTIRARVGAYLQETKVKVTPCTQNLVTYWSKDIIPDENTSKAIDFTSDDGKKLLKPVVLGEDVEASDMTVTTTIAGGVFHSMGVNSSAYTGIRFTDPTTTAQPADTVFFTLEFKLTPKKQVTLGKLTATTHTGKGDKKANVKVTVGNNTPVEGVFHNRTNGQSTVDLSSISISTETTVKVEIVQVSASAKPAWSVEDLQFSIPR